MAESRVVEIALQALWLALLLSAPVVLAVLVVGLVVSLFQAATQIQEQSLGAVLKIAAAHLVVMLLAGWMLERCAAFFRVTFDQIAWVKL